MNGFLYNLASYTRQAAAGAKQIRTLSLSKLWKVFSLMSKREKIVALIFLSVAAVSLYFSVKNFYINHTNPAAAFGGTYTEGVVGQPAYINPILARLEPDMSLTGLVFSGLYKYNAQGRLVPNLAADMPSLSEDQKQYTINLRQDLKWHNGRPLTADDIIFTIQLLKEPAFKSPFRSLWQTTTVEKLSDYSVKFITRDVSGPFVDNLTVGILPKSIWSNVEPQNFLLSKNNLEAMGSGPYLITEINKLPSGKVQAISLEANSSYHEGRPNIEKIVVKFYDTEEDVLNAFHSREIKGFGFVPLGSNLQMNENQNKARIMAAPLPQHQVLFFNLNSKILAEQSVREALVLATDKEQIIRDVFKGHALLSPSPFLSLSETKSLALPLQLDVAKAKEVLEKAGWKIDPQTNIRTKKTPLEITIFTNDSSVNAKAAESLAEQWKALNIKTNLSVLPGKELMEQVIKPRSFDILLFPQKFSADPDPFLFWHSSQVKDPGYNLTGFKDQEADKLISEARTTTDRQARQVNYEKLSGLILAKHPLIFLDQTEFIYVVDNKVKNVDLGVIYDPSQRFNNVANWYITERRTLK